MKRIRVISTNREWLRNLSNKELADFFYSVWNERLKGKSYVDGPEGLEAWLNGTCEYIVHRDDFLGVFNNLDKATEVEPK